MFKRIFAFSFIGVFSLSTAIAQSNSITNYAANSARPVFAGDMFSQDLRQHASTYQTPDDDTFVSTLLGVCKLDRYNPKKYGIYEREVYRDKKMVDPLPVRMVLQERKINIGSFSVKIAKKAPLYIYIPGLFSSVDDKESKRQLSVFSKLGYHVLTFPNPMSADDFLKKKPSFKPGHFTEEAALLYRAIKHHFRKLRDRGLIDGVVHLSGVSYGAFMAAIIAKMDAEQSNIINGTTTVIAPPFHFGKSVLKIDEYIRESKGEFAGIGFAKKYQRYLDVCHGRRPNKKDEWAQGIVIFHAFQERMINAMEVYRKHHNISGDPMGDPDWKENMVFMDYFNEYAPELLPLLNSDRSEILNWINEANQLGKRVRVLTSDDDWLNDIGDWKQMDYRHKMIFDEGGHYGFRHLNWWDELLEIDYSLDK